MKVTNGDIFTAREPLTKIMEQKFPVMVSYKLAKMMSKLNGQYKVIEDVRNGLIKKYGEKDEKGNIQVKPDGPNWTVFIGDFNELMALETEIVFEKVKLPEKVAAVCDKCSHNMDRPLEIEPKTLMALDKFVEV